MSGGAIQSCPRCGEGPAEAESAAVAAPWVCAPCRAEHAGAIQLRLPHQAHSDYTLRLAQIVGEGPDAQETVEAWAAGLDGAAKALRRVAKILRSSVPSEAEAVAAALMASDGPTVVAAGRSLELRLEDLPASLARKLAEEVSLAHPPDLTDVEILALAAERRA